MSDRPRFLISRLSSLGDVVCTLPVASALKAGVPGCEVVWAADPRFAGIVDCCSAVDVVLRVKPGFQPRSWPKPEGTFDVALDMQGLLKSALVVARSDAKRKLGYHWQREGAWLFSHAVLPDPTSLHVVDQYVDVARAAGGAADRAEFALAPAPEAVASIAAMVQGPYAVFNPGAGWVSKRWPPGHFAALSDRVQAAGVRLVLIGGRAEADRAAADEVLGACKEPPLDLVGKTSVLELVALLHGARFHVGGDTGSSHITAALGVPAVGLYSITRPQRSCPYGQVERCHYDPDALANITPDAVWDTLQGVMEQTT